MDLKYTIQIRWTWMSVGSITCLARNCCGVNAILCCNAQKTSDSVYSWPPYVTGQAIIFLSCGFFYLLLFSSPNLSCRRLDVYHTSTHSSYHYQWYISQHRIRHYPWYKFAACDPRVASVQMKILSVFLPVLPTFLQHKTTVNWHYTAATSLTQWHST